MKHTVIFGGNGFIGTAIAEYFVDKGSRVSCVSRSGSKPRHLETQAWAEQVQWLRGDVASPDKALLDRADCVITAVGSAPLPTFSQSAFDKQYAANGAGNIALLEACARVNPAQIIVISASVPRFLQSEKFAYFKGKNDVVDTAVALFGNQHSDSQTQLAIIRPSSVTGRRYLKNGCAIPLHLLEPLSALMQKIPLPAFTANAPVAAAKIAAACWHAWQHEAEQKTLTLYENDRLLSQRYDEPSR